MKLIQVVMGKKTQSRHLQVEEPPFRRPRFWVPFVGEYPRALRGTHRIRSLGRVASPPDAKGPPELQGSSRF